MNSDSVYRYSFGSITPKMRRRPVVVMPHPGVDAEGCDVRYAALQSLGRKLYWGYE